MRGSLISAAAGRTERPKQPPPSEHPHARHATAAASVGILLDAQFPLAEHGHCRAVYGIDLRWRTAEQAQCLLARLDGCLHALRSLRRPVGDGHGRSPPRERAGADLPPIHAAGGRNSHRQFTGFVGGHGSDGLSRREVGRLRATDALPSSPPPPAAGD